MKSEPMDADDQKQMMINAEDDNVDKRMEKKRRFEETEIDMQMLRSPHMILFPLQRLYMACLDVFKGVGTVPSPSGERRIRYMLDGMIPEDIGIRRNLQFFHFDRTVIYTIICHSQNFLLYAVLMPPNSVIPLHNHPGMTVFSKLLLGKVHIKAYDMLDGPINSISSSKLKLTCLKKDGFLTAPCGTSVLYPTSGGNIHEFRAITPCVILDVVGPPFSKEEGRDCSYYKDVSHAIAPNEKMLMNQGKYYRWLEEFEITKELLKMDIVDYLGPKIIEVGQ